MTKIVLKAALLLSFGVCATGCNSDCLRNTDCNKGATCSAGTCIIIVHVEAGSVAGLTPGASETPPVDSAPAPVPTVADSGAAKDAGIRDQ